MAEAQWKKNIGPHQLKPGNNICGDAESAQMKAAATRRRTKALRNAAQMLLWHSLKSVPDEADVVTMLHEMGIDDPTGADAIMLAQYVKARRGDTEAARFIRDTAGEKPSTTMEVNHLLDKPIGDIDFSRLSDEELEQLVQERNMTLISGSVVEAEAVEVRAPVEPTPEPEPLPSPTTAPGKVVRGVKTPVGNYPWGGVEMNMNLNQPEKHRTGPKPKTFEQILRDAQWDEEHPEEVAARKERKKLWKEQRAADIAARKAAVAAADTKEENEDGSNAG